MGILERDDLISSHYTLAGGSPVEAARYDFTTRVAAAAKAGFTGIGLHFAEYEAALGAGMTDASMRAVLATTASAFPSSSSPGAGPPPRASSSAPRATATNGSATRWRTRSGHAS